LLTAVPPYRAGLVVAVECLFTWYGLADLGAAEGLPCVLGHALSMKARHGGTAKNDTIDSHKSAALRRGGRLPNASGYPAERRATRDVLRRRPHLRRPRAALLAHVHNTNRQSTLPAIGKKIASKANREGGAARFDDRAVQKTLEVALARLTYEDERRTDLALFILKTATHHAPQPLELRHTVPGIGKRLRLVGLYAIHRIDRLPSVQECAAYARLGPCSKASGGQRVGTVGNKIGPAPRTWALSAAAPLFLRPNPQGQHLLARLEKNPAQGQALSRLAPQLGRAVSGRLPRQGACDRERFLQT
jgi:transposase